MSILNHPAWSELRPYIRIENYGRDTGPHGPRGRVEVKRPDDPTLAQKFLDLTMPCVACGLQIHPIRERVNKKGRVEGHPYYGATCQLGLKGSCSKGRAASSEYQAIRRHMERWWKEQEPELF